MGEGMSMNSAAPERPAGETFPAPARLRTRRDFQAVFQLRKSVADGTLVVYARRNKLGFCRLGLSVSRKVGNAVVRNRWKRLIRESFRKQRTQLPPGLDLVVIPRQGVKAEFHRVNAALRGLAERADRKLRGTRT